jgi:anti-sigma B factor antagonist
MLIDAKTEGAVLVARPLVQRLDASVADSFRGSMSELMAAGGQRVLLDLEEVQFIDSSGLGAIVSIYRRLGRAGALAICGLTSPVLELFRLTRLDHVCPVYPDKAAALAALAG